ncbi:MAG TPA: type IV pilus secretin PilQ [Holophagaceae bacterium]|jgi:type IV pilus assembly protein PilQ|nr:type IV pilus secretin PilQ [Holophagaceae bacterium]
MMNARLSTLLVAGAVTFTGLPGTQLRAETPASVASRACTVETATLASTGASSAVLTLAIPGMSQAPKVQVLDHPHRVVVDLPGVERGRSVDRQELAALHHPLIERARMAQFAVSPQPVTRMVLEVADGTQVAVSRTAEGVQLSLNAGTGQVQAHFDAAAMPEVVAAPAPQLVAKADAPSPAPVVALGSLPELPKTGATFQALPVMALGTAAPAAVASPEPMMQAPAAAQQPATGYSARTIGQGERRYTGAKVSIDLPNTDLVTFLRYLADVGHLNLVCDSDVQGTATYKFTDVPWDQVLDIILKNAGLGKEIDNGVLRVAKISSLQREAEERGKLAEAKALSGDLETVTRPLSYAKVAEASQLVTKLLSKRGSVIVDERTNTLIVTDLPAYLKTVEDLLQTLDIQIQQVSIEARVVEANKDWQRAFGVEWPQTNGGVHNLGGGSASVPWFTSGTGPSWNGGGGFNRTASGQSLGVGIAPGLPGVTSIAAPAGEFWVSFLSNRYSVNFILQALEKDGVVKIVSSPKVVAQNNRKATILSGQKIPYPTQQGGAAGGAITVAFIDANLQLDVTPQITNEGTILLELKIAKAEADFSRTVNGTPTILNKSIETQVLVRDGGTAVLGGVYVTNTTKGTAGVPFLMNIPIIGALFRTKSNSESTQELLIFITPRILHQ